MNLSCLFIEDSQRQLDEIQLVIRKHFPMITDTDTAMSVEEADKKMRARHFDLLLSDIELGDKTVFEMLEQLPEIKSKIIFISSFSDYAIEAFKFSALSYLLKPYSTEELVAEVNKTIAFINQENYHKQLEVFFHNLKSKQESKRLVLKNHDLIHIVDLDDILYAQADNNYTHFFCKDRKILVSKSLKTYEDQLAGNDFFRCHNSYLINLQKIKALDKAGDAVILHDDSPIPVASSKKKLLYQLVG